MGRELIYAFRVMRLPLLDSDGGVIGRVEDIVLGAISGTEPPSVLGFVARSQRRRIFVNAGRIATLDNLGARLRSSAIDLNPFKRKQGELLVKEDLLDRPVGGEVISDVGMQPVPGRTSAWEVADVALAGRKPFRRRRTTRHVGWAEVATVFTADNPVAAEVVAMRDMHPSDVAAAIRNMPLHHRRQLASVMEDERLADLLEELPEAEQLRIIEGLDLERLVSVLEEMEYDDAADLLAEMTGEQRTRVLEAMEPEEATELRRLLSYTDGTAGHLMTPDPITLGPHTTVAEALAQIRDPEISVAMAAQVFVTLPPWVTPTGTYLGVVHFQRLLREPPAMELGRCLEQEPTVLPDLSDREVAERLAAYNLMAIAVCDDEERLLGAITVDDVLDRTLPVGWRQHQRQVNRRP
ncbi:MAG: CBS domain-containing protein [Acidimicrobiia bacterium]